MAAPTVPAASNGLNLEQIEASLLERREILSRLARALEREEAGVEGAAGLALDFADLGAGLSVHDLNLSRLEAIVREIADIDGALERVREGAYGLCESCGAAISRERLEAIPFATLCRECKIAEERL